MQKNLTQLKCSINGKEQTFTCEIDANTIEVKEGLLQFLKYVGQIEDAHQAKLKAEQDSKIEISEESKEEIIEA